MGWILNIIGLVLFIILSVVDLFTRLFTKRSENSAYSMGYKLNVFGNEMFGDTLNIIMLKKGFKRFGKFGEPLSSAYGHSYVGNELNWHGKFWRFVIDVADLPLLIKRKSHCKEWRRTDEEINNYRKTLK